MRAELLYLGAEHPLELVELERAPAALLVRATEEAAPALAAPGADTGVGSVILVYIFWNKDSSNFQELRTKS